MLTGMIDLHDNMQSLISFTQELGEQSLLKEILSSVSNMDCRKLECYAQAVKTKAENSHRNDIADQLFFMGLVY